jgi:hypothetical protein
MFYSARGRRLMMARKMSDDDELDERLVDAQTQIESLQTAAADAEARAETAREELTAAREARSGLEAELTEAAAARVAAEGELSQARYEVEEMRSHLAEAAEKYREAKLASAPEVPQDLVPAAGSLAEIDEGFEAAKRIAGAHSGGATAGACAGWFPAAEGAGPFAVIGVREDQAGAAGVVGTKLDWANLAALEGALLGEDDARPTRRVLKSHVWDGYQVNPLFCMSLRRANHPTNVTVANHTPSANPKAAIQSSPRSTAASQEVNMQDAAFATASTRTDRRLRGKDATLSGSPSLSGTGSTPFNRSQDARRRVTTTTSIMTNVPPAMEAAIHDQPNSPETAAPIAAMNNPAKTHGSMSLTCALGTRLLIGRSIDARFADSFPGLRVSKGTPKHRQQ